MLLLLEMQVLNVASRVLKYRSSVAEEKLHL